MWARREGDEADKRMKKVVGLLYSKGARLDERNYQGSTPLNNALLGNSYSVSLLLDLGVGVNDVHPRSRMTPLQALCMSGLRPGMPRYHSQPCSGWCPRKLESQHGKLF